MESDVLLAILKAYRAVQAATFPDLHPGIEARAAAWDQMDAPALHKELARLIEETNRPGCEVRVFWKRGSDFTYGGCNKKLAQDAGFDNPDELVGMNDFDHRITWLRQSPKYRADDLEVVKIGAEKLNIIERQRSAKGNIWLRTGKAPIRPGGGTPIGLVGMYEVIDVQTAMQMDPALRAG
jgi:hypothetical protein